MSEAATDDHDRRLLADLLSGDRSETAPEVLARLRARPDLAAELAALRELAGALQDDGADRRAELVAAQLAVTDADVAAARSAIARHFTPRRRWRAWPWLAAAALALLLVLVARERPVREPRVDDPTLATDSVFGLEPRGDTPASALSRFHWSAPAHGGYWRLVMYAARNGEKIDTEPLLSTPPITANEWQPSEEQLARLRTAREFLVELTLVRDRRAGQPERVFVRCSD